MEDSPGLHLRQIDRNLDVPLGTIRYHLRVLEKKNLVTAKKEGKYKRFYAKGSIDKKDKKVLAFLRKEIPRTIILFLMEYPGSTHKEINEALDIAPSTLSYHLKKLKKKSVVISKSNEYHIKDQDKIADLLVQYQQTFLDSLVDRFVRIWNK
ncbi:MAG: winged helix-turn-helix transcriptional regulator [Candidatus Saliniplasma sp.]